MTEDWDFYFLRVDNEPASIYLDLGLAHVAPISSQPNLVYVRVKMLQPREDGLSSAEEFEALSHLEDRLVNRVVRDDHSTYAGRNTSSGNRDFYFYTDNPSLIQENAEGVMTECPRYRYETGHRIDSEWRAYFEFLYPSCDDLARILNRRVTDRLVAEGDDLSKPRMIDHAASVTDEQAAGNLRNYLRAQGFTVEERKEGNTFIFAFERIDRPDQIDDVELPIARRVRDLRGAYDGWGCEVVKSLS